MYVSLGNSVDPDIYTHTQRCPIKQTKPFGCVFFCLFFVALRTKTTAMVMEVWSAHLTTLFP